jgi:hypothetical protein
MHEMGVPLHEAEHRKDRYQSDIEQKRRSKRPKNNVEAKKSISSFPRPVAMRFEVKKQCGNAKRQKETG